MFFVPLSVVVAVAASSDDTVEELVVEAPHVATSASERVLDRAAIEATPGRSADDLLRAMPGLHESAHGGHGKAYQYFLRGFDAVHGADLAVDVEGVPVNEVSNVHAHGYLDLHFIPPVLLRTADLRPGTWSVEAGDFAVAGSASLGIGLDNPGGLARLGAGTDTSAVATLAWRPARGPAGNFAVVDADVGQGVGESRAWRQVRGGVGGERALGGVRVRAWVLAYDGIFESPGVLRESDLTSGAVDLYDAYPGSGGGHSGRVIGAASARGGGARSTWRLLGFGGWRSLTLQQNFTGWYGDEVHGDGSLQRTLARTWGGSGEARWGPARWIQVRGGLSARRDVIDQAEDAVDPDGEVWATGARLAGQQVDLGGWLASTLRATPWLSVRPGLRGDVFVVDVDGRDRAWAPVLAPKFGVTLFQDRDIIGFFNYGRGFRSPDIRGAGDGGRAPVATADSFETGVRGDPVAWLSLRGAGFATLVSDEIIFDHAAARYLASGSTRRVGADLLASLRPVDPVRVDLDLTWSDGRYVATAEPIPYAPRLLVVLGASAERLPLGPGLWTAGLRAWGLGPRPLPGGFASHPAFVVDLTSAWALSRWGFSLDVDNVLGARWLDGEFMFASRWDLAEPHAELPVRHITAGTPRAARLAISRSF